VGQILALIRQGTAHAILLESLQAARIRHPQDPYFAYLLATLLAASPEQGIRDGARALDLAKALYEREPTPGHTELLAMAYAETGDYERAVTIQQQAVATALAFHRLDLLPRLSEHLTLFQERQPSRTPWPERALAPSPPPRPGTSTGVFRGYPAEAAY
jgi:hypothetical protein